MSSSAFVSLLSLLTFAFLVQAAVQADNNFLSSSCSNVGQFAANDAYEANLNNLMGYLYHKTAPSGFGIGSMGQKANTKAYGLALCRGDVTPWDCKSCVIQAGKEIRSRCPYEKGAIIWYDNCLVKYSNKDFFDKIDYQNKIYLWNWNSVSDPIVFNQKTKDLLSQLAKQARGTPKLYASGQSQYGSTTIYGLTQCTRDLTSGKCKKCLEGIISELPNCCDGKEGGRVLSGSCNFRYEIYPFVN